ncbi:hypothetical protein WKK05_06255 [Nostoc sp. UHCC 0302]|uniref:hypothetical protein n=1 Tax=Nostoc sp. UHCC 0302 TaxID=3134896 RepID=UPI00311CDD17
METDLMKLAIRQVAMQKFAQPMAFMQQAKNFSCWFLYRYSIKLSAKMPLATSQFSRYGEKPMKNLTPEHPTLQGNGENSKRPFYLFLTCLLIIGLCSCGNSTSAGSNGILPFKIGSNVTPIREIKPKQNNQTVVYIQGKVEKQAPLVKRWAYQINDSTGKIWVITNQSGLKEGSQMVVKGKIRYQSIPLAGKEFGEVYLEEE